MDQNNGNTIATINYQSGNLSSTILPNTSVNILYLQVAYHACQAVNLTMSILIDLIHRVKKCPGVESGLVRAQLGFRSESSESG